MPISGRWVLPSFGHRGAVADATEWPASNTRLENDEDPFTRVEIREYVQTRSRGIRRLPVNLDRHTLFWIEDDETNRSQCLSDVVLDGLLGVLNHRRRGRCPFPSELPGACIFDSPLPIIRS